MLRKQPLLLSMSVLLGISLAINVLQSRHIYKLQANDDLSFYTDSLRPGTKLPSLRVADISGASRRIEYNKIGKPTILYIFQPNCVWCKRNAQAVNWLASKTTAKYVVIGVSLHDEGLSEFIDQHRLAFPVYKTTTNSNLEAYGLGITPETIVIAPDGSVVKSWNGAYLDGKRAEIEKFFRVSLPD